MFKEPSVKEIPDGTKMVNVGFGNRCLVCGGYFDEGGICNYGHHYGWTYYYPPKKTKSNKKHLRLVK